MSPNCWVLHELVDTGNTVTVIEHTEVIKTADWIIDIGPEGGDGGGEIVATGTPEDVVKVKRSHTGTYLAPFKKDTNKKNGAEAENAPQRPKAAECVLSCALNVVCLNHERRGQTHIIGGGLAGQKPHGKRLIPHTGIHEMRPCVRLDAHVT